MIGIHDPADLLSHFDKIVSKDDTEDQDETCDDGTDQLDGYPRASAMDRFWSQTTFKRTRLRAPEGTLALL
jgi:hypothetical protein